MIGSDFSFPSRFVSILNSLIPIDSTKYFCSNGKSNRIPRKDQV